MVCPTVLCKKIIQNNISNIATWQLCFKHFCQKKMDIKWHFRWRRKIIEICLHEKDIYNHGFIQLLLFIVIRKLDLFFVGWITIIHLLNVKTTSFFNCPSQLLIKNLFCTVIWNVNFVETIKTKNVITIKILHSTATKKSKC